MQSSPEPVAITGIGLRSPLGNTVEDYWRNLCAGASGIGPLPADRFDVEELRRATPFVAPDFCWSGGFLTDIDRFDPDFFGIPAREAEFLDPQQRLLLEVAWEALEDGGIPASDLAGKSVGVYVGCLYGDYEHVLFRDPRRVEFHVHGGALRSGLSGRLSYFFGFEGPSLTIDAACASSLAAIHLACQSLRASECCLALAGGVNVILQPQASIAWSRANNLAGDGRVKFGDADADGMVRSEGAGLVVLKRLADAVAANDTIYAIICGSAVNHGGRRSASMVKPSQQGQADLLRQAYRQAGMAPGDVHYVEAHGTGTRGGDFIELSALGEVLGEGRGNRPRCRVGSVKTNLGHAESAAGVLGLIKAALCLRHGGIPASLNLTTPNPRLDWQRLPLVIPQSYEAWPEQAGPRYAGVSSFGVSGANAHLVLQESRPPSSAPDGNRPGRPVELVCVSAVSPPALAELAEAYEEHLHKTDDALDEIAYVSQSGRTHLVERLAVVASSPQDAARRLAEFRGGAKPEGVMCGAGRAPPRVAFLFTGQGSQYSGMGRELYESQPYFREIFDRCGRLFEAALGVRLTEKIFLDRPDAPWSALEIQPAIVALELALAELWRSWGVQPALVMGHSLGEYAAAVAAGVMSLETCVQLVAARARLVHSLPAGGGMLAVLASAEQARQVLARAGDSLSLAADNGPSECVVAGGVRELERFLRNLDEQGIRSVPLAVSHAMHSSRLEPMLDAFEQCCNRFTFEPPRAPWVSCLTGAEYPQDQTPDASYWRRQLRQPVQFRRAMETLLAAGCDALLEIGPSPVLLGLAGKCGCGDLLSLPSLRRGRSDWRQMLESAGALHVAGAALDWRRFPDETKPRRVKLPLYRFQRQRHWFSGDESPTSSEGFSTRSNHKEVQIPSSWSLQDQPFLSDHEVHGQAIFPAAGHLEILIAGGKAIGVDRPVLRDVRFEQALRLHPDQSLQLQFDSKAGEDGFDCKVTGVADGENELAPVYALGKVSAETEPFDSRFDPDAFCADAAELDREQFYANCRSLGLMYGTAFQGIERLWRRNDEVLATIQLPAGLQTGEQGNHPALLDAILQTGLGTRTDLSCSYVPLSLDRWTGCDFPSAVYCLARRHPDAGFDAWAVDLEVFTRAGMQVGRVEGLVFRRVAANQLTRAPPLNLDRLLYQIEWRRAPRRQSSAAAEDGIAPAPWWSVPTLDPEVIARQRALAAALDRRATEAVVRVLHAENWRAGDHIRLESALQGLNALPRHGRLVGRMLDLLAEDGMLAREGDSWRVVRPGELNGARAAPDAAIEWSLLTRCCDALPDVLAGRTEPLSLLFSANGESAERLYRESLGARTCNALIRKRVHALTASAPSARILEIGAGTGGTTENLLSALPSTIDYTFTDLSPAFLAQARERFAGDDRLEYRLLDIEREPLAQGFSANAYDVVLAANVLHATRDLRATLEHIQQLLAPGGHLVLLETIRPQRWLDLTFGMLDGWWRFADGRLDSRHPLASADSWARLLEETGYTDFKLAPDDAATQDLLGAQVVISARSGHASLAERGMAEGAWLLFADGNSARDLAGALSAAGGRCVVAQRGARAQRLHEGMHELDPSDAQGFRDLWQELQPGETWRGVVYLWGIDEPRDGDLTSRDLEQIHRSRLGGALHLVQALTLAGGKQPNLFLLTRGGQAVWQQSGAEILGGAPLWGLAKVVALECPDLPCVCIDLDPAHAALDQPALVEELCAPEDAAIVFRQRDRYVARLRRQDASAKEAMDFALPAGHCELNIAARGALDGLQLSSLRTREPGVGELQVQVRAAGLNFRDVMNVLGLYPGEPGPPGRECAGIVTAVGPGVDGFTVGERVIGFATGSFATSVTAPAQLFHRAPENWDDAESATLPAAAVTARLALERLAQLRPGERVLIHAAAGGVGIAAVQLAQNLGAEVFATASKGKWPALREFGVQRLFDSRSLDFVSEIRECTQGAGVEVVLNSLAGNFIPASLDVLGAGGRFVEIGKRGIWSPAQMTEARPDVRYHVLALDETLEAEPGVVAEALEKTVAEAEAGRLAPLPVTCFPLHQARRAFRWMQQARHVGKIVITVPPMLSEAADPSGAYLIVGGLGGLGLAVAQLLADHGARRLVLMGRSKPAPHALAVLDGLRSSGVEVTVAQADVAVEAELAAVLAGLTAPLRGVVHSAGVLADGVLAQQSWSRFETVLAPKVSGAWNLHRLTLGSPLDFFVVFSSVASVLGSPGQANHAAANAFLDGLVAYRRNLGLPALSINWGAWGAIGAAAGSEVSRRMQARGVASLDPRAGLEAILHLLRRDEAQAAVMALDWPKHLASYAGRPPQFLADFAAPAPRTKRQAAPPQRFRQRLFEAAAEDRWRLLSDYVRGEVARMLDRPPDAISDDRAGLQALGLDSLMAVEFRNRLQIELAPPAPLSPTLAFDHPNLAAVTRRLYEVLFPDAPAMSRPAAAAPSPSGSEAIAIIGVGCRFPGEIVDFDSFARLLFEGREAISEVPRERWDLDTLFDPDPEAPGKVYTRHAAFLRDIDCFDAAFFGISPREALSMDPQQRLLLEVAWEALENAALDPDQLFGGNAGVFLGLCGNDYAHLLARRGPAHIDSYFATGAAHSVAAGRLSYVLGLHGPAMAIDTACSSSLVAVHAACESLRRRECDLALSGGVNVLLTPEWTINFCRARMLARDGHCKPFAAAADGFVRGEGCGLVVLRRLSDAVQAGDRILAIVRGAAINQDGRSGGLTAPHGPSQEAVVRQALKQAGVRPAQVGYVEAHGTGTPLGDPIEVQALAHVHQGEREQPLIVGSVKANLGHLEGAAGIAGLLKAVVLLEREAIPPQLHVQELSPHIPWDDIPLRVTSETLPWRRGAAPRLAGVSSFGLSGANAHVILEEPPLAGGPADLPDSPASPHLLALSGRCASGLDAVVARLQDFLASHPEVLLNDVCATANLGRSHGAHRIALVFRTRDELLAQLAAAAAHQDHPGLYQGYVQRRQDSPPTPAANGDPDSWLHGLARHYTAVHAMAWDEWRRRFPGRKIELPTYPFQRQRFWPDAPAPLGDAIAADSILGPRLRCAMDGVIFETSFGPTQYPLLWQHRIQGRLIAPGAWFLSMIYEAAAEVLSAWRIAVEGFEITEPLVCQQESSTIVQTVVTAKGEGEYAVSILSLGGRQAQGEWTLHARACVRAGSAAAGVQPDWESFHVTQQPGVATGPFYERLKSDGVALGPGFRVLERFWLKSDAALTEINPPQAHLCRLHPSIIDACFQSFGVGLSAQQDRSLVHVLVGVRRLHVVERGTPRWCIAQILSQTEDVSEACVTLFDERREVLAHLDGVRLRRLRPAPELRPTQESFSDASWRLKSPQSQLPKMQTHVRSRVAEVLGFASGDEVGLESRFFEVGMDSLRALELQSALEQDFNVELPATLVFEHPTAAMLSQHLHSLLAPGARQDHSTEAPQELPGSRRNASQVAGEAGFALESLAEEELEEVLRRKIEEVRQSAYEL